MHELRQRHCRLREKSGEAAYMDAYHLSEHALIQINTKPAALYLADSSTAGTPLVMSGEHGVIKSCQRKGKRHVR